MPGKLIRIHNYKNSDPPVSVVLWINLCETNKSLQVSETHLRWRQKESKSIGLALDFSLWISFINIWKKINGFFLEIFITDMQVWIFVRIFDCFESISSIKSIKINQKLNSRLREHYKKFIKIYNNIYKKSQVNCIE